MAEPRVLVHADEACLGNGREPPTPGGCGGLVEVGWVARARARAPAPPDGRAGQPDGDTAASVQGELWSAAPPAPPDTPATGLPPAVAVPPAAASAGGIQRFDYVLSEPDTTNNRMALRSAIAALELSAPFDAAPLTFVTDSSYVVRGMNEWVRAWRARGWRRKGGAIENLDLWQELDRLVGRRRAAGRSVEWTWVRGHAGHAKNEYANFLATRAAADQGASPGLVPSGFAAWLASERARGRYTRYDPDGFLR